MRNGSFQNIFGEGKNAENNHFFPALALFLSFLNNFKFCDTIMLFIENALNLVSKIIYNFVIC